MAARYSPPRPSGGPCHYHQTTSPAQKHNRGGKCMGSYLAAVWRCRFFWLSLVKMDLRTRYRRSILGMGWSLLHPIAMTIIICLVFRKLLAAEVRTFAPYLLGGLACWNYILSATTI